MPDTTAARLYALIHACGPYTPGDLAALHAAADFSTRHGGGMHALIVTDAASSETVIGEARKAGATAITSIQTPESVDTLQPHQLADLFIALLDDATANGTNPPAGSRSQLILVSAGTRAEEASGAIAARIDAVPAGRPKHIDIGENGALRITRSGYGGRLDVTQVVSAPFSIAAVRAPEGSAAQAGDGSASGTEVPAHILPYPVPDPAFPMVTGTQVENETNLEGARLVISGGRGMGGEDGFSLLRRLAVTLDGALGGSLPAVDAGWAPVSRQVGQSGKYVTPDIYLAVGISGTPQHLAGIDPHSQIIAVNKDPDAPIFQVARVGILASWEAFLPALLEAIEAEASP